MSFICIVCRDLISATAALQEGNTSSEVVVTKCGHMYHLKCLTDWFNSQDSPRQECPYCKTSVGTNEYQRVFPAGDEETDEFYQRYQDALAQQAANGELQEELNDRNEQLITMQAKYEDECIANDLLRYEYSKLLSKAENISSKLKLKLQQAEEEIRKLSEASDLKEKLAKAEEEIQKLRGANSASAIALLDPEVADKGNENTDLKAQLHEQSEELENLAVPPSSEVVPAQAQLNEQKEASDILALAASLSLSLKAPIQGQKEKSDNLNLEAHPSLEVIPPATVQCCDS